MISTPIKHKVIPKLKDFFDFKAYFHWKLKKKKKLTAVPKTKRTKKQLKQWKLKKIKR